MRHRGYPVIAERDPLHFPISGMVDNGLRILARPCPGEQHGRVLVRHARELVQRAAGQGSKAVKTGMEMVRQAGRHVKAHQAAQIGIGAIEVQAGAVGDSLWTRGGNWHVIGFQFWPRPGNRLERQLSGMETVWSGDCLDAAVAPMKSLTHCRPLSIAQSQSAAVNRPCQFEIEAAQKQTP